MGIITGMGRAIARFGNTETIDYSDDIIMTIPELYKVLNNLKKEEDKVREAINVTGGSKKGKGGLKKYEKPTMTIKEMTPEKLEDMRRKLEINQENDIIK